MFHTQMLWYPQFSCHGHYPHPDSAIQTLPPFLGEAFLLGTTTDPTRRRDFLGEALVFPYGSGKALLEHRVITW